MIYVFLILLLILISFACSGYFHDEIEKKIINAKLPIINFHIRRFNVTLDKRDISYY